MRYVEKYIRPWVARGDYIIRRMLDIYKHSLSEYVTLIAYGGCFVA
jgi:hypothetical protein